MSATGRDAQPPMPWLVAPLARALEAEAPHAWLIHGPRGVGQFELAKRLATAWLCEGRPVAPATRPCGACASCRLVAARTHPDLLVLVPAALREALGEGAAEETGDESGTKKKPSREIRIEAVRAAIEFANTTSARGRGKAVVVHPAERMNPIAANALLKTLEEPPGATRFALSSASPDALLPTIRSRCQQIALPVPAREDSIAWLASQGVADAALLLDACGGQPQDVLAWLAQGMGAADWQALPQRVMRGDASSLAGRPLAFAVDALLKLCHDAAARSCGATARYFPVESVPQGADLAALLAWGAQLRRVAENAEHPWIEALAVESLVDQGKQALKTPRSAGRGTPDRSLHSAS